MPDTETLNPQGLMRAVKQGLEHHRRVDHELGAFMQKVTQSEALATEINEAVARQDESALVQLLHDNGISHDLEVQVQELRPNFHCAIRVCFLGFCGSCSISW